MEFKLPDYGTLFTLILQTGIAYSILRKLLQRKPKKLPLVTIIKNTTKLGSLTIQILQRCSVHTERLTRRHIDNVVYYSFGLPSVSLLDNKIFTKHESI